MRILHRKMLACALQWITLDFTIQKTSYIQARRPNLVVIDRKKGQCFIIDIAVPGVVGVGEKERKNTDKYQDLRREVAKRWNIKTTFVPIVVGALGVGTENLIKHLKTIGVSAKIELLWNAALLGTARLLRKVLEAWGYETWLALSTTFSFSIRSGIHLSCVNLDIITILFRCLIAGWRPTNLGQHLYHSKVDGDLSHDRHTHTHTNT